jgi:choline dehydrogenase-like flavoprotein
MFFDRGSKADYDAWEALGNPSWNWESLFPYFRKAIHLGEPSPGDAAKYGYTWDAGAYGNGPIQASYALYQYPGNSKLIFTGH